MRKNLTVYKLLRSIAPFLCRIVVLEDGFSFLGRLKNLESSNRPIIDIGSNDGTSINMIRQYFRTTTIYAFDPVVKIKPRKGVIFNEIALGANDGHIGVFIPKVRDKFTLTQYSSSNANRILEQIRQDFKIGSNSIQLEYQFCRIATLDSFALDPFFIKIDVEGLEIEVLKGAKSTIDESRPIMLIELNTQNSFAEIIEFLSDFDYQCFVLGKRGLYSQTQNWIKGKNNYVFSPRVS